MATGPVGQGAGQVEPLDVLISFSYQGKRNQTGFSMRKNAALLASPSDAALWVETNLFETFRLLLPTTVQLLGCDVSNALDKTGASRSPASLFGSIAGALGPAFIAMVMTMKGEKRTRMGHGRMFLPCFLDTWTQGDALTADGLAAGNYWAAALTGLLINGPVDAPYKLINWHPLLPGDRPHKKPEPLPEVPATWYDVSSVRINPVCTSLKSRKVGQGS